MRITAVVVDDQPLVRSGFRMILEAEPDIAVVGEAPDGKSALEVVEATRPDVVLMDVRMPGMDGIEATRRLCARRPCPKVLILTTFDLDEYVFDSLRAGASGFLLKDASRAELARAVRVVHGGDALLSPEATRRLIESFRGKRRNGGGGQAQRIDSLTRREREVLTELARGRSNAEVASVLFLSEHTVKSHVANILMKLGVRDRVQAVIIAYESQLVSPGT